MQLPVNCLIVRSRLSSDPRSAGLLSDAHALGLTQITALEVQDLYFIEGAVTPDRLERLAAELLGDLVAQTSEWRSVGLPQKPGSSQRPGFSIDGRVVEVALRPGVTDPVAEQIVRCAKMLGIDGVERAATGQRYIVQGRGERRRPRSPTIGIWEVDIGRCLLREPPAHTGASPAGERRDPTLCVGRD